MKIAKVGRRAVFGCVGAVMVAAACDAATVDTRSESERMSTLSSLSSASASDVLTHHNDNDRSGAQLAETKLNVQNVRSGNFGRQYSRRINGQVYAQPLYVHGVATTWGTKDLLIVATLENHVYAYDPNDASVNPDTAPVWELSPANGVNGIMAPAANTAGWRDSNGLPVGNIAGADHNGILSTPVVSGTTLYFVARAADSAGVAQYYLYDVDIRSGARVHATPTRVKATIPNGSTLTWDPTVQLNRPALLYANGSVYIAFGSLFDGGTYHGWVMEYDGATLAQKPGGTFCTTPNGRGGGIWQAGSGLAADSNGYVYFITGNGTVQVAGGVEDSIVRLEHGTSNQLVARNFLAPNASALDANDCDLGSSGPLLLPGNKVLGGGKEGKFFLVDRASMQTVQPGFQAFDNTWHDGLAGSKDDTVPASTGYVSEDDGPHIHGSPIRWQSPTASDVYVYAWSEKDHLKRFTYQTSTGHITSTATGVGTIASSDTPSSDPNRIEAGRHGTMPGGMLSLSANGSTTGTGIVWATIQDPQCTTAPCDGGIHLVNGRIYAFDAENLGAPLWNDAITNYSKHTPPTVVDGRVFVATDNNEILVYGLNDFEPALAAVSPSAGRIDAFFRRSDFKMYHATWNGTPRAQVTYEDFGCCIIGAPEAVSASANRIDVVARGTDRGLYHKTWNGSGWAPSQTGWDSLGGVGFSRPSVVAVSASHVEAYVTGDDLHVYRKWWDASTGADWLPAGRVWQDIGGVTSGAIRAVAVSPTNVEVVIIGTNYKIYHKSIDPRTTTVDYSQVLWQPIGSNGTGHDAIGRPALIATANNRVDVFIQGADGSPYHGWWDGTTRLSSNVQWEALGGALLGNPEVIQTQSGTFNVFLRGTDQNLHQKIFTSFVTPSGDWLGNGGDIAAPPTLVSSGSGRLDVLVGGTDGQLYYQERIDNQPLPGTYTSLGSSLEW